MQCRCARQASNAFPVCSLSEPCRFPNGWESHSFEERDSFKRTRFDIEDVLRDCAAFLGPLAVLAILTQQLQQTASGASGAALEWRDIEAAYHCMGSLKDERLPHGHPMVLEARCSLWHDHATITRFLISCCHC
jgi:hypothetical protein